MIHYSIFESFDTITAGGDSQVADPQRALIEAEDKLRRTQSLFQVYYLETMPMSIEEEETPIPMHLSQPSLVGMEDDGDEIMGRNETPKWGNITS